MKILSLTALAVMVMLGSSGAYAQTSEPMTCEEARCLFQQQITDKCPCDIARNHGQYVKCVGKLIRDLSRDGSIPRNCRGKLVRCAARSTCGKEDFVTCTRVNLGTCDLAALTCVEPAGLPCASDADCVIKSRCSTKRSAELCLARGGVVGETPTCCSNCVVEPPAGP
jgi:hypothetical protein